VVPLGNLNFEVKCLGGKNYPRERRATRLSARVYTKQHERTLGKPTACPAAEAGGNRPKMRKNGARQSKFWIGNHLDRVLIAQIWTLDAFGFHPNRMDWTVSAWVVFRIQSIQVIELASGHEWRCSKYHNHRLPVGVVEDDGCREYAHKRNRPG
jgi:hypothetical protein